MEPFKSYVICTSPRSGSTLLCRLLAQTGQSGHPNSHFHTPSMAAWLRSYDLSQTTFPTELAQIKAVFAAAIARGTQDTGIFGLRLQRHSFDFFMQQLGTLHPGLATDKDRISATFGPTLFIHLTRQNKLDQAISLVKANQTGLWHKSADGSDLERTAPHQDPIYDVDGIMHYCVANMPGAVARTSTIALGNATMPFMLALADKGWKQACEDDQHLLNGLNVHAGSLTYYAVGKALGIDVLAPALALKR